MKKKYSLLVDGDVVPFELVSLNAHGSPLAETSYAKVFAYENNPTIVNITGYSSMPGYNSLYVKDSSGFPFTGNVEHLSYNTDRYAKFVLVVGNLAKVNLMFDLETEVGTKLNAIFLSNPKFLEPEIIE